MWDSFGAVSPVVFSNSTMDLTFHVKYDFEIVIFCWPYLSVLSSPEEIILGFKAHILSETSMN